MPIGNFPYGDFICNSDAEMLTDGAQAVVGTTCLRTDVGALPGTLYVLGALPNNILTNWQPYTVGSDATNTASSEYHTHFFAPLATGTDRKAWDISGALSDGVFQTDLSAATAWATAGFLTQPNPSVSGQLSLVQFPAISWDWAAGDSLFLFWAGRGTPDTAEASFCGDAPGATFNSGIKLTCTGTDTVAGKIKCNVYQNSPSVAVYGPMSTNVVIEASVTHSFAMCIRPHVAGAGGGMCFWTDGERNAGHAAGFLMPSGGPVSTVNAVPLKLGGDGQVVGGIQAGIALQTRALVVLKGRRGNPPNIADMDALVRALHANQQALVNSDAW